MSERNIRQEIARERAKILRAVVGFLRDPESSLRDITHKTAVLDALIAELESPPMPPEPPVGRVTAYEIRVGELVKRWEYGA